MAALSGKLVRDDHRAVLVGLSGGLDSVVLLHALASMPARPGALRAIHVHHGLHADAERWANACQRICDGVAVPLTIDRVEVVRDGGEGPEAAARKARHLAFETALRDDEVLALAHHQDDQAETFLLRALRGSGPDGLGAMQPWRSFGCGWLWRPLLDVPRTELLAYAQQHALQWIDDSSNADVAFDRNFLRHRVLPLLRERWPRADAALARSAALSAEATALLETEDAHLLAQVRGIDPKTLDVASLSLLPEARRARLLRCWIATLDLPPLPATGVARIESQLLAACAGSKAKFAWAGAAIRRWRGLLHADIQREPLPSDWQAGWDGASPLPLPTGGVLRLESAAGAASATSFPASPSIRQEPPADPAPAIAWPLTVHARHGGERITLPGRSHSHALKHVLQDLGVPPWVRARLPLVSAADGELLAVGDLVCSAGFDRWLRERGARLVCSDSPREEKGPRESGSA